MNNFKTHEDAVDLTEKYSAYQLAKMLLEAQEKAEWKRAVDEGLNDYLFGDKQ